MCLLLVIYVFDEGVIFCVGFVVVMCVVELYEC